MLVAVVSLTVLLLTVAVAARRSRPVARPATAGNPTAGNPTAGNPTAGNVVSLDAYRAARLVGHRASVHDGPPVSYPLTASAGGFAVPSSGGGLRTCRQPDGRLGRPLPRIEPA